MIELSKNFYLITAPNKSRFPFCNTFLLKGKETVLIDAGFDRETLLEIDKKHRIDILVFSHSHPDHILNWHLLKDRHILMPKETPGAITDLQLLGERFMGSREKGAYWAKRIGEGFGIHPLRLPDNRFREGDVLELAGFKLKPIHAPGHLDDHYVFFEQDTGILLTSDIDFSGFGPFYFQPEGNITKFKASIQKIMSLPYKLVASSHKMPIKGDATEGFNKFTAGFDRHMEKILAICETPHTMEQIVQFSPVYDNRMPDKVLQDTFEEGMVTKCMELMIQDGRITKNGNCYVKS
jgi:glyoxylase-like metal-dependent hydrolase (beta-lactamase superfamily II)